MCDEFDVCVCVVCGVIYVMCLMFVCVVCVICLMCECGVRCCVSDVFDVCLWCVV